MGEATAFVWGKSKPECLLQNWLPAIQPPPHTCHSRSLSIQLSQLVTHGITAGMWPQVNQSANATL